MICKCGNDNIHEFDYDVDISIGQMNIVCLCCNNRWKATDKDIKELENSGDYRK